jgi:hypothetical protein
MLFLLIAAAGLMVLIVLLARGLDTQRAAESGPRWRRQLVCAALFLLGCLGCSSGTKPAPPPSAASQPPEKAIPPEQPATKTVSRAQATAPVVAGQSLDETPQWQYVTAVWREAEEVASGKRGDYPFDEKGKKDLLAAIQVATSVIGKLSAAGTLSAPEAQLLTKDLGKLEAGVQFKRPTELRNATCYEPMLLLLPAGESLKRLRVRIPLLQKLAAEGKVHLAALEKVLPPIEADLKTLTSPEELKRLDPQGQTEAAKIRREGEAALGEIKKLLEAKK